MLGSAVSSSTPSDFQPSSQRGEAARPLISRHAPAAPPGNAYVAVGMQRALDWSIGLPKRSTNASWMLVFLMPAEVRRSFMPPLGVRWASSCLGVDPCGVDTRRTRSRTGASDLGRSRRFVANRLTLNDFVDVEVFDRGRPLSEARLRAN